ncbi:MAG TPA: hypothetical protein VHB21_24405 [Minicystis sp.]|nr:hypothetical protein [Minicystis sp.]
MNEPRRLLSGGGSDFEVELLRSARDDAPAPHARRRAMIALGIGTGVVGAGVTAATTTAAATSSAGGILKWIGIGVVGGGLFVGGAQQAMHLRAPAHVDVAVKGQTKAVSGIVRPVVAKVTRSARVAPPAETAAPEVDAPEPPPKADRAEPAPSPRAVAKKGDGTTLAEEVKELDAAREALNRGESGKALEALERHDKQFGTALLGPEAMVLRMEALAQRGDKAGAAALANQFLALYPTSPHAARVRSILASSVSGPATPGSP